MEDSKRGGAWKQIVFTLHCPYCVDGNDFRAMLELGGSPEGIFFCSSCHHVIRSAAEAFKCDCTNCQNLDRGSGSGDSSL